MTPLQVSCKKAIVLWVSSDLLQGSLCLPPMSVCGRSSQKRLKAFNNLLLMLLFIFYFVNYKMSVSALTLQPRVLPLYSFELSFHSNHVSSSLFLPEGRMFTGLLSIPHTSFTLTVADVVGCAQFQVNPKHNLIFPKPISCGFFFCRYLILVPFISPPSNPIFF